MNTKILDKFNLTEEEKKFIQDSQTQTTGDMNQTRVIADIYLVKTLENVTDKMIGSNQRLADSNNRYAKAMTWLTFALVLVGVLQIIF